MDKKKSSYLDELLSGHKDYIYYSLKDFKDNLGAVEHGRNGIYAFSKNKVNLKLKPNETMSTEFPNFYGTGIIEQTASFVDQYKNNIYLKDRSNIVLIADLDIMKFEQMIGTHPIYGPKLSGSRTESYDLLFETGMELKPILHYSNEDKIIEIVGFCDNEDLEAEESSSLEEKIKSIFGKNQFGN
jgi:hypothetical protein